MAHFAGFWVVAAAGAAGFRALAHPGSFRNFRCTVIGCNVQPGTAVTVKEKNLPGQDGTLFFIQSRTTWNGRRRVAPSL